MFTQVDVTTGSQAPAPVYHDEHGDLLRDILASQDRTNEILEELTQVMANAQKQRVVELNQWKQANPELARCCREAAEGLSRVQIDYLERMTDEINNSADGMMEGEFMLNEFVDRFGPRLAHLNGVIQVLAQLSSTPNPSSASQP
jgi:hypothetical protein